MSKHTPGPWHVVNAGRHWNNPSITNYQVQTGPYDIAYSPDGELVAEHVYEEADARLIAAAPQMLATLKGVDDLLPRECESANDRFERVSAAFHRDTGMLAPGKDPGVSDAADRRLRFDDWYHARVAAVRAAITQAEGLRWKR